MNMQVEPIGEIRLRAFKAKRKSFANTGVHLLMAVCVCAGLAGCKKEGPMEKAGRNVDETATDVGNKIEDKCEQAKDAAGAKDTRC